MLVRDEQLCLESRIFNTSFVDSIPRNWFTYLFGQIPVHKSQYATFDQPIVSTGENEVSSGLTYGS